MAKVAKQEERLLVAKTILRKEKKSVMKAAKSIKKAEAEVKKTEEKTKKAVKEAMDSDDKDDSEADKKLTPRQKRQKQVEKLENKLALNKTQGLVEAQAKTKKAIEESVKKVKKAIAKTKDAKKPVPKALEKLEKKNNILPDGEKAMGSEKCFYIKHLTENQVVTVDEHDAYTPKKTGVYNIELGEFKPGNKAQMFSYDAQTKSLKSYLFPKTAVMEGQNKMLVVFKNMNLKNQKFVYDIKDMNWVNNFSDNGFELDKDGTKVKKLKGRHDDGGA